MKKPCYLVLILCVCCLPLLGQAISQSEAIDKGYSIIANQAGLSREDLRFGQAMHHKSDGSWTLSFFRKQRQWENDGVYRVEIASNGNLKELALPGEVRLSAHMSVDYWEVIGQEYGFYNQNLLALRAAWGEHLQAMIAQEEARRKPVEENFCCSSLARCVSTTASQTPMRFQSRWPGNWPRQRSSPRHLGPKRNWRIISPTSACIMIRRNGADRYGILSIPKSLTAGRQAGPIWPGIHTIAHT